MSDSDRLDLSDPEHNAIRSTSENNNKSAPPQAMISQSNKESSDMKQIRDAIEANNSSQKCDTEREDDGDCDDDGPSGTPTITAPPSIVSSNIGSTADDSSPISNITPAAAIKGPVTLKKKELIRPLFSRTNTSDKPNKSVATKSMIVETETVDSTNAPSVTLPIAPLVTPNDLMANGSGNSTNMSSLRSKKSTVFIDNSQTITSQQINNNPALENDNISITGSIRNPNKHLTPSESHMNMTKPGATKADLFAAKIANAVGGASDSDSEETFVYESAPDTLNAANTLPVSKGTIQVGIANQQSFRNQRNSSMPMASTHPLSTSVVSDQDQKERVPTSFDTEESCDPDQQQHTLTKPSLNQTNEFVRVVPLSRNHNDQLRKPSTASFSGFKNSIGSVPNKPSQLRTTTSKLFDVKGSTLRRYSGVPDDVNIEDYIDQYDEEQEIESAGGYADTYDYDDYEEDDELTPLNLCNANNKLRSKASRHYANKRNSSSNFGSMDRHGYADFSKDEVPGATSKALRGTRSKIRPSQQYLQQDQHSPHNFFNDKKNTRLQNIKNVMYFLVFVFGLLAFGFIAGFLLATTKELQDVDIQSVDDVLVSYDELVFDLNVQAFNPGFMTIEVSDLELDIFAKSSFLDTTLHLPIVDNAKSDYETILLGTASKFETPLEFRSGLFNRNHSLAKSAVKLLHPGRNYTGIDDKENHKTNDDSDKWKKIMEHPFELIIRGTFTYEVPLFGSEKSIPVTKSVAIDPDGETIIQIGDHI